VPGTVQGVLQARLEDLGLEERATLQHAAVVGRAFWDGAAAYIGQQPVPPERWGQLQQRDLIFQQPTSRLPGEREYHFKHTLLRDVVYEYTLKEQRRAFHQRAAEWLVSRTADRAGEWAPVIAGHFEQARDAASTAEWYRRAGRHAQATYAPQAAIAYYEKALAALPQVQRPSPEQAAQQAELHKQLAELLRTQARYAEALEALAATRLAAQAGQDRRALIQAWCETGLIQSRQGDFPAATASIAQAEEIARDVGSPAFAELAAALIQKGMVAYRTGDAEAALALGEQAHALASSVDETRAVADSWNLMGAAHWILGNYDQTDHYFRQVLALCQQLGNRRMQQRALNNLGANAYMRGDYLAAALLFRDALAVAEEIGDRDSQLLHLSNLGGALAGQGDHHAAEICLQKVLHMTPASGLYELANSHRFLAEAYLGQGKLEAARASALEALRLAEEMAAQDLVGRAWRMLGAVAAALGQPVAVHEQTIAPADCFAESLRIFETKGAAGERGRTLRAWARYEIETGDPARGARLWQEALGIFERLGLKLEVERMAASRREQSPA